MFGTSKIKTLSLGLGLSILLGTAAFAQSAPASAASAAPIATKIGIINIQEAIENCNEGKKEADQLQTKFGVKQADLKNRKDEFDNLTKQLQAQGDKLSDEERAKRVKDLEGRQKGLQRDYEDFQNEVQQAQAEVVNRIGSKMMVVLGKYAKANAYSVVMDVSTGQTVLWANDGTVFTKDLVDAYNVENPVSGVPAAKPAGGAAAPKPAAPKPTAPATTTPKKP
jgi:outer membrane protein